MKYLIGSDLHGSSIYIKRMLEAFEKEECDKIILLGDLLYHGPRNYLPKGHDTFSAVDELNKYKDKIICVQGNCDANVDEMVLEFPIIHGYKIIEENGKNIMLTHGDNYGPYNLPPKGVCDILISGHTHIPMDIEIDGVRCINPGSTSIPKGNSRNSCIVYENEKIKYIYLD